MLCIDYLLTFCYKNYKAGKTNLIIVIINFLSFLCTKYMKYINRNLIVYLVVL